MWLSPLASHRKSKCVHVIIAYHARPNTMQALCVCSCDLASRRARQVAGSTCERAPWCRHITGKKLPLRRDERPCYWGRYKYRERNQQTCCEGKTTAPLLCLLYYFIHQKAGWDPCHVLLLVRSHVAFV